MTQTAVPARPSRPSTDLSDPRVAEAIAREVAHVLAATPAPVATAPGSPVPSVVAAPNVSTVTLGLLCTTMSSVARGPRRRVYGHEERRHSLVRLETAR
jgi:hypothetical protein